VNYCLFCYMINFHMAKWCDMNGGCMSSFLFTFMVVSLVIIFLEHE